MLASWATRLSIVLCFIILGGGTSYAASVNIELPINTIIDFRNGKQIAVDNKQYFANFGTGDTYSANLVFYVNGEKRKIKIAKLLNVIQRIDFLTPGLKYTKEYAGNMLISQQNGRQINARNAFFNRIYLHVRKIDDITNEKKYIGGDYAEIQSIIFNSNVPVKCGKCGKLYPPSFKYCPIDGEKLTK